MTRVLCCAAHPDDAEIGCGATLAKHVLAGDETHIIFMADGETSRSGVSMTDVLRRQAQSYKAAKELGIPEARVTRSESVV